MLKIASLGDALLEPNWAPRAPKGASGGVRQVSKNAESYVKYIETHVPNLFGKTRGDAPFKKHCILRIKTALRAPSGGLEGSSKSPKVTQKAREAKNSQK